MLINPLFKIFPRADIKSFEYYLRRNKNSVKMALYCYGLFLWEFEKYKQEIKELKEFYKKCA